MLDELTGRAKARALGLQPIGILAVLLKAKRNGQLNSVTEVMDDLKKQAGFFIANKLDEEVVAVSPSSVYRVLKEAGRLNKWDRKPSKKGTGFEQPLKAHQHWHIDITYLNICSTFYYLCRLFVMWYTGKSESG